MNRSTDLLAEQMRKAAAHRDVGELGLAESHYRRAVKLDPRCAEAWHRLGRVEFERGKAALAIRHYRKALEVEPGTLATLHDLALAHRQRQQHAQAVSLCRQILAKWPGDVPALLMLGSLFDAQGELDHAGAMYRQVLAQVPGQIDALVNLGGVLRRQHRPDDALALLVQACRSVPCPADAFGQLAQVMLELGRYAEARQSAERAISREPAEACWWRTAGIAARLQHDLRVAVPALRKTLELAPDDVDARAELALALHERGDHDEAVAMFVDVARKRPGFERIRWLAELALPAIYTDEAQIETARRRFGEGLERVATRLDLDNETGRLAAYEAASTVTPFHLHYQPRDNTALQCRFGDLVQQVLNRVAPAFTQPLPWQALAHGDRIRVGFVSSHLSEHSVTRFFGRLVTGLDGGRFEVSAWNTGPAGDAVSRRIAAAIDHFHSSFANPAATAAHIRDAKLDVLVHLDIGMDPAQQVLAALRLAPVQCCLYGHPATSGMPLMDYFLSGAALEPEQAEAHYRETLVRLPGLATQPARPPPPGDGRWLDAYRDGRPLLLCLQNLIKLVPAFDDLLARAMVASDARVVFFDRATALGARYRERLAPALRAHGLSPGRDVVFVPHQSHANFIAGIAKADVVLDTPWFSGGSTSLDALSVGTPIVTIEGAMLRGRQTAAMLRLAGVPELIAANEEAYVDTVRTLCRDIDRRASLRNRLIAGADALFGDSSAIRGFEAFVGTACQRCAAGLAPMRWP
ncbi:MAG: tetratricopeptide repeat protein [Rhodanobacteraceae bacterium]